MGVDPGVVESLEGMLVKLVPGLKVVGSYSPPFRHSTEVEEDGIIARINDAEADIVWVGLGSPKQEYWMAAHLGRIDAPLMIGVGAAFDFLSGSKPQAPLWIQAQRI